MAIEDDQNLLPERIIYRALELGINAISADLTILDRILGVHMEDTTEQGKFRTIWQDTPPTLVLGYPRTEAIFPCYAITLASDPPLQHRVGKGARLAVLGGGNDYNAERFSQRINSTYMVLIYATHPDVCAWYYRVARRILNVATAYLIKNGLTEPEINGQDLVPDPRYTPEHVFVRRLSLTIQYEETWTDQDGLWDALNDPGYPTGIGSSVEVFHEDQPNGGVHPYTED